MGNSVQDRKVGRIQPGDPKDVAFAELLGDMWWDQLECDYQQNLADLRAFIADLAIPDDAKQRLLALTPASYTGNAAAQALKV